MVVCGIPALRDSSDMFSSPEVRAASRASRCGISVSPSIRAKFLATFDPAYAANQHRVFLWARSLEMFRDHPVAGIGWGNYQAVCPEYIDRVDPDFPFKFRAHSLYFNLLAETGVLGLLAVLILFGVLVWQLLVRARGAPPGSIEQRLCGGVLAGVCAVLVGSVTTDAFYNGDVAFVLWFLAGSALSRPVRAPAPTR